jgi:ABC-2 type transport system ATP-binding protein
MPAVEITDLVVRYGELTAVDHASFSADAGEVTAVLGPNGAGKTSTIESLEGYRRPASGTLRVLGFDPIADHARLRSRMGVMLQSGGVYPGMGPADVLRLFAAYYPRPQDPMALLERLGLAGSAARTPWRRLSGGEKQRLSLALALVGRPDVAFLDEPTAGVDPAGRKVIRDVIDELKDHGVAVLVTTHELEEVEKLADRVVILDHGRVVADGSMAALTTGGDHRDLRFRAASHLDIVALSAHLEATVVEVQPGEYVVSAAGTPNLVAALTAWLADRDLSLGDLRAGRQSLEEVFLRLTAATPPPTRGPA